MAERTEAEEFAYRTIVSRAARRAADGEETFTDAVCTLYGLFGGRAGDHIKALGETCTFDLWTKVGPRGRVVRTRFGLEV